jgi:hypothetical protein
MEDVGLFYGRLVYFTAISVYFFALWYILLQCGIYVFRVIWYIFLRFGTL